MRADQIRDRISRGLGTAARHIGDPFDAYRTTRSDRPLAPQNRYLRLSASFSNHDYTYKRPTLFGQASWAGIFDTAYTRPGDYLAGPSGTYFIAAQQPLLPALCILTTNTVEITRPAAPAAPGIAAYGGFLATTAKPIITGWPASILSAGTTGSSGALPGDGATSIWTILLPPTSASLRSADIITDDLGRAFVIGSAELTSLGWRLLAKQAMA